MDKEILVSIIIPTYDRLSYLKELVESIDLCDDLEIILSQDRYPDQGYNLEIHHYGIALASQHANIHYQLTGENRGLAGNWNEGVAFATGKYSIILGDDDCFCEGGIDGFLGLVQHDADIIFTNHLLIDSEGRVLSNSYENTLFFNRGDLEEGYLSNPERKIWENAIPISSSLIKTALLKREPFRENINTPEIEFFLRAWNKYHSSFYFFPEYLIKYRVHHQSATKSGLSVHRLLEWLKPMPVSQENEPYKLRKLQSLAGVAVAIWLREENYAKAKEILRSAYFPGKTIFNIKYLVKLLLSYSPFLNRIYLKK